MSEYNIYVNILVITFHVAIKQCSNLKYNHIKCRHKVAEKVLKMI